MLNIGSGLGTAIAIILYMKIAISHWQGRISTVFDVASEMLLVDVDNGQVVSRRMVCLGSDNPFARIREMAALGIELLICGAISLGLETSLINAGVEVVGFSCGAVDDVLHALVTGQFKTGQFRMPGARWGRDKAGRWADKGAADRRPRAAMRRSRYRAGRGVSSPNDWIPQRGFQPENPDK